MGKFNYNFDETLTRQLERMGNYDEIAPTMLEQAAPILAESISAKIKSTGHVVSGDLADSISPKQPSYKDGWYVLVTPTGYSRTTKYRRKRGTLKRSARVKTLKASALSNAAKLIFIEYGTSKQAATPILESAVNNAHKGISDKMQEVYNEVVERG